MGAVEETRKAIQDFIAPELRSVTTRLEALHEEQARLRSEIMAAEKRLSEAIEKTHSDIVAAEGRTRAELIASETRVTSAIDRLRTDMPLLIRNAVLEQLLAEKQRVIEDLQKPAH